MLLLSRVTARPMQTRATAAAARRWAVSHGPALLLCVLASAGACAWRSAPLSRDVEGLATALGRAAGGAAVVPTEIRWEPAGSLVGDLVAGRWLLFLARSAGQET